MKRAAVITDVSSLGNCSGSTDIAVLSAMGFECCIIPTAVLSAQTGFNDSFMCSFYNSFDSMIDSLQKISPKTDAVFVGFMSGKRQTERVLSYVGRFVGTDTLIVTDPITGDNGRRFPFVSADMLSDIRLISEHSDIITPNLTEFCLLTETDYSMILSAGDNMKYSLIADRCSSFFDKGVRTVIVTGIELSDNSLSNLCVRKNGFTVCKIKRHGGSYSGTGDLFTAIVCGSVMQGLSEDEAVSKAAGFIEKVLCENADNIYDRNYGIPYQKYLGLLTE